MDGNPARLPAPRRNRRHGPEAAVGYVSAFFGVLNHHDRSRFEIHLLADADIPTAERGYHGPETDHVWQIRGTPNARIAAAVAAHCLDILVHRNGYSHPKRLGLFTRRAAPAQFGWFDMFATTGSDAVDAPIGEGAVIPPEEEGLYAEGILRMPGSDHTFTVNHPAPEIVAPPCLAAAHITFGSLCSASRLADRF